MKAYSVDPRKKIVNAYQSKNISVRKLAVTFGVGKAFVQKILKQYQEKGHVNHGKQGTRTKAVLADSSDLLIALVKQYPDATLSEYCEYWLESQGQLVSSSMMCRELQKLNLTRKKKWSGAVKLLPIEFSYSDVNTERKLKI